MEATSRRRPPVRVFFAVDNANLRRTLRSLVKTESDLADVGGALVGPGTAALARREQAEVIIVNVGMPAREEIAAIRDITRVVEGAKVIALSMERDTVFANLMRAIGATACVWTDRAFDRLVPVIRELG